MSDEDLKIESLKIATNIGKLMSNVTTEDIVSIAETVAKFIKGSESLTLDNTDETESNEEATADTDKLAYDLGVSEIIYKPFASPMVYRRAMNIIQLFQYKRYL